jgi:response regulator RpfG family c-di-GMP phosphodiesterase
MMRILDLTLEALLGDVRRARRRVEDLEQRLRVANRELAQRRWEVEHYEAHGRVPKRKGLARRVAEQAELERRAVRT